MRNLFDGSLARFGAFSTEMGNDGGVWTMWSSETNRALKVVASIGGRWEHVSVSLPDRCPTWGEMEQVKRAFFNDNETAMQLHVPPADHISYHPYCLHLWRPLDKHIPRPPKEMIA
jgi:hypothetical protein